MGSARIPQIIKNYRERSCEGTMTSYHTSLQELTTIGLSLLFFIFSLLGNASYGAGVSLIIPFSDPFPIFFVEDYETSFVDLQPI